MQFPITIGLRRSPFLGWGVLAVHGLALAVAVCIPWSVVLRLMIAVGLLLSGWVAWRQLAPVCDQLRLQADGRIEVVSAGSRRLGVLLPEAVVHPWLTVIRMVVEGYCLSVVITPDCLPVEDFRRLRVWLRWRADFSGDGEGDA